MYTRHNAVLVFSLANEYRKIIPGLIDIFRHIFRGLYSGGLKVGGGLGAYIRKAFSVSVCVHILGKHVHILGKQS